jgi:hypothetical protein
MSTEQDLAFLKSLDKRLDDTAKVRAVVSRAMARSYVLGTEQMSSRAKRIVLGRTVDDTVRAILELMMEEK